MEPAKKLQTLLIILSVLTPIILASLYIGDMSGRLKTLESDRDYSEIKNKREKLFVQTDQKFEETRKKADETIKLLEQEIERYEKEQTKVIEEFKTNITRYSVEANKKLTDLIKKIHLKEKRLQTLNREIWQKKKALEPINNAFHVMKEVNKDSFEGRPRIGELIHTNKYIIRLGVFSLESGAKKLYNDLLEAELPCYIGKESNLYKVEIGPFSTRKKAEQELQSIKLKFPNGKNVKEAYILYRE